MGREEMVRLAKASGVWDQVGFPKCVIDLIDLAFAHEREACAKLCGELETCSDAEFYGHEFANAIRARGDVREHIMSGDCWCNPELNYTDPETGSEVWVHKEPQ